MAVLTVVIGVLAAAAGAQNPATIASIIVAALIVIGAPSLTTAARHGAQVNAAE